jgi:hypothetical protein
MMGFFEVIKESGFSDTINIYANKSIYIRVVTPKNSIHI